MRASERQRTNVAESCENGQSCERAWTSKQHAHRDRGDRGVDSENSVFIADESNCFIYLIASVRPSSARHATRDEHIQSLTSATIYDWYCFTIDWLGLRRKICHITVIKIFVSL